MADEKQVKLEKVTLKTKTRPNGDKPAGEKKREFPIKQANALLGTRKKAWQLADDKYEWNGEELVKKGK